MTDSTYPSALDTDVILPRVDDNITEISGESINGLRSAVFHIETALGIDPQGSSVDLATRLDVSLNQDGSIKSSALSSIGLVTLPITNSQIATNAGIEESKLDLDHGTSYLYTLINNLNSILIALGNSVAQDISNLSRHIIHPNSYGRHQTYDIDGYTGKFTNYNLQGIITEIDTILLNHIAQIIDAHNASAISIDNSNITITADNVQTAIEQLDALQETLMVQHRTLQHGNGLIEDQTVNILGTSNNGLILNTSTITLFASTRSQVTFSPVPAGLSNVVRDDIIIITIGSNTSSYHINTINTSSGVVTFFGTSTVSGTGTAKIYVSQEEKIAPSPLIVAIKKASTATALNIIQLVHPGAPFILSSNLDGRRINVTSSKFVKINWATGTTGDLNIYTALSNISTDSSAWVPIIIAQAFNDLFVTNYLPLIAFEYKGQLGLAFDEALVGSYIEIDTPSSASAWPALGFVEGDLSYSKGYRKFYIDGYQFYSIHKKIDTTAQATGTGIDTFPTGTDLIAAGLQNGEILRIESSSYPSESGTHVASNIFTNNLFVYLKNFTNSAVSVKCYDDSFALITPVATQANFYEIFVDGYDNNFAARLNTAVRAHSAQAIGSGSNYVKVFDIIDVSRNFVGSPRRIFFNATNKTLQMGQRGAGITLLSGTGGNLVSLPTSPPTVIGYRFRLYDNNKVDYIDFEIADTTYISSGVNQAVDITIYDRISEKYFLQIGVVLHNGDGFKQLSDRRLFGNIGRKDIRDDFTRDYITYPTSVLRGNGVIYGLSTTYDGTSPDYISVDGGQVLVNGSLCLVETAAQSNKLAIPVTGLAKTYNLFVDSNGVLNLLEDNAQNTYPTPSLSDIIVSTDKTIIAQIFVNTSDTVTSIVDLRRFVGNIDNKIELMVEENDITNGSFASLKAAFNWINACDTAGLPTSRTIKIRGEVLINLVDGQLAVPNGITIKGDFYTSSVATTKSKIVIYGTGYNTFVGTSGLLRGVRFEGLMFEFISTAQLTAAFIQDTTIDTLYIENCCFNFDASASLLQGIISATTGNNINIRNNIFKFDSTATNINNIINVNTLLNSNITSNYVDNIYNTFFTSSSASNVSLSKNIITCDPLSISSYPIIYLEDTDGFLISENVIDTLDTTSYTSMIYCYGYATNNLSIIGNRFINYKNVSDYPIFISDLENCVISDNQVLNCINGIVLMNGTNVIINNNIMVNDSGRNILYYYYCNKITIVGNNFVSTATSHAGSSGLVYESGCSNDVCSNNIFSHNHIGASTQALMQGGSDTGILSNNIFCSLNGGTYNNIAPIYSQSVVMFNWCRSIVTTYSYGIISATERDFMNWGQTYSIKVPACNWQPETNSSNRTCWYKYHDTVGGSSGSTDRWMVLTGSYGGAFGHSLHAFVDSSMVPVGATILGFRISYSTNVAADLLKFRIGRKDGSAGITWLCTEVESNPPAAYELISATYGDRVMDRFAEIIFQIRLTNTIVGQIEINFMTVDYLL